MTVSRRVKDAKSNSFHKNILKRGDPSIAAATKEKERQKSSIGPMLIGFFFFVVVGSSLLQLIRAIS